MTENMKPLRMTLNDRIQMLVAENREINAMHCSMPAFDPSLLLLHGPKGSQHNKEGTAASTQPFEGVV